MCGMFPSLRETSSHLVDWSLRDAPSDGLLKVITGSMVLMRGKRSESNLYVLQVESDCLGHIDNGWKSTKKVTFDDGKGIGLEGEIVKLRVNSYEIGNAFDHLVAHAQSCTIEDDGVCEKDYRSICFGSLNKVINDDDLECFDKGYRVLKKGVEVCLD